MTDSINEITPGTRLSEEQRAKLAKDNANISAEANRLASERRAQDVRDGRGEPVVKTVADSLKNKLERNEFQTKEPSTE